MGDRAVILGSQEPPPSPPPHATLESSSGDSPWPQDAAAPANTIQVLTLGYSKTFFN